MDVQGIVLLNKPSGLSSNAALQRVRRRFGGIKAGHAGTLDPLATGMLPIFLGEATKFIQHVLASKKAYRATLSFGSETSTGDREGEVVRTAPCPSASRGELDAVLSGFIGRIRQRAPIYSAIKRDGVPLYRLARQGRSITAPEREIEIERIDVLSYSPDVLEIEVVCGSGTYIRSLGIDIGRALGSAAHLAQLHRSWVRPFESWATVGLDELMATADPGRHLLPVDAALSRFGRIDLSDSERAELGFGRRISDRSESDGRYRLYDREGRFLGLGLVGQGVLRVDRLLAQPVIMDPILRRFAC